MRKEGSRLMQRRKRGAPPFLRHFPRGWMEARNLHEGVKKEKSIPVPIKRRRKKKDGLSFSLSLKNLHYHSRPFSLELKGPPTFYLLLLRQKPSGHGEGGNSHTSDTSHPFLEHYITLENNIVWPEIKSDWKEISRSIGKKPMLYVSDHSLHLFSSLRRWRRVLNLFFFQLLISTNLSFSRYVM